MVLLLYVVFTEFDNEWSFIHLGAWLKLEHPRTFTQAPWPQYWGLMWSLSSHPCSLSLSFCILSSFSGVVQAYLHSGYVSEEERKKQSNLSIARPRGAGQHHFCHSILTNETHKVKPKMGKIERTSWGCRWEECHVPIFLDTHLSYLPWAFQMVQAKMLISHLLISSFFLDSVRLL